MSDPVPFGRYRLVSLLGQGGMATVYRGVRAGPMGFEKPVAVKCIDPSVTEDQAMVRALINEARLGGRLRHPNIVEIYEFDQVEENWFMAMEFVEGWTLHGLLQACRKTRQWVPHTVSLEILAALCRALTYAHGLKDETGSPLNLVHRDLKPGNVLVSRQGDVKLMDFGIAKAETNLYKTTAADATKGTPVYMSPEQVDSANLDRRSDIFSLGSMTHEMITLQVPFPGETLASVVRGILATDIAEVADRVARRIHEMGPVVGKMMDRDIDARYADSSEILADIEELQRSMEGPTVAEWVESLLEHMPRIREVGDFGRAGPPNAVGTVPSPTGLDSTMEMNKRSTQTAPHVTVAQGPGRGPLIAVIAVLLMLLGGAAVFVVTAGGGGNAVVQATPTPAPVATPQLTPTPQATPAPTPAATPAPTPRAMPRSTPRAVAAATPKPTPVPVPAGIGTLQLNSDPWSKIFINGKEVGNSPQVVEKPAGTYTVRFVCEECSEPLERTYTLQVKPDEVTKKIIRLE